MDVDGIIGCTVKMNWPTNFDGGGNNTNQSADVGREHEPFRV